MPDPSILEEKELAASAARVVFARELACAQARKVNHTIGRNDELTIDLLFLMQETVLVCVETHRLVTAIGAGKDVASLTTSLEVTEQLRALKAARRSRFKRALIMALALAMALAAMVLLFLPFAPTLLEVLRGLPVDCH